MLETAIALEEVTRRFPGPGMDVLAVDVMTLTVEVGAVVALIGPSGSGKTTVLNLIAGLDRPTRGSITVLGHCLDGLSENSLTAFRAQSVGIVFQDPHLLPGLTALENVVVARLPWRSRRLLVPEARELLNAVGLNERVDFPPARLSGGERQRVGIARALLGRRPLLLADEPTGNLDAASTEDLLELLARLRSDFGITLMVATHDPAVAAVADRIVRLAKGRVEGEHSHDKNAAVDLHSLE